MSKNKKALKGQSHINKQIKSIQEKIDAADKQRHRYFMFGLIGSLLFLVLFIVGQVTLAIGIRIEEYPAIAWTIIIGLMITAFGSMTMWTRYARYKGACKDAKAEMRYYSEGWYNKKDVEDYD